MNEIEPGRSSGSLSAVVLGNGAHKEFAAHCGNCARVQETIARYEPNSVLDYDETCQACSAHMTPWTTVAVASNFDMKRCQASFEEDVKKIFHDLLQSTWESHVREWVDGERWDEGHISSLARYARDEEFIDIDARQARRRDSVWRPRFQLEGRDEFEPGYTYEIPIAGQVGNRAWNVVEIKSDDTITVIKESGDVGMVACMDKRVRPLERATLGELIDYGEVYRVVDINV